MSKEVTAPSAAVEELPRVVVRRLVKEKLVQLRRGGDEDVNVQKEALLAFAESARIFIHYLSATCVPNPLGLGFVEMKLGFDLVGNL